MSENYLVQNIRAVRAILGLTQDDFAKLMGTKRTTLAHYEQGGNDPSLAFMEKFCDLTELDLKTLRSGPISPEKTRELRKTLTRNIAHAAAK